MDIGTFEAKCVAYICLLFALDGLLREKTIYPASCSGLTFSFHPAVGMWSILAAGLASASDSKRSVADIASVMGSRCFSHFPDLFRCYLAGRTPGCRRTGDTSSWCVFLSLRRVLLAKDRDRSRIFASRFSVMIYLKGERRAADKFLDRVSRGTRRILRLWRPAASGGTVRADGDDADETVSVFAPLFFFWYLAKAFEQRTFRTADDSRRP